MEKNVIFFGEKSTWLKKVSSEKSCLVEDKKKFFFVSTVTTITTFTVTAATNVTTVA